MPAVNDSSRNSAIPDNAVSRGSIGEVRQLRKASPFTYNAVASIQAGNSRQLSVDAAVVTMLTRLFPIVTTHVLRCDLQLLLLKLLHFGE